MTSEITADEILDERGYIDLDIYNRTLVVSTYADNNAKVLFYKLNY